LQCKAAGIKDVILDPGFGFAKTVEQNFHFTSPAECIQNTSSALIGRAFQKINGNQNTASIERRSVEWLNSIEYYSIDEWGKHTQGS
jgi:hypothetical protein